MDCYNKLDKIDKIFISLVFIIVTIICIFNNFCYASTDITNTGVVFNDLYVVGGTNKVGRLDGAQIVSYPLKVGHTYELSCSRVNSTYSFSESEVLLGVSTTPRETLQVNKVYSFTANNPYLYVYVSNYLGFENDFNSYIKLVDVTNAFSSSISQLYYDVGVSQIFSVFEKSIPFLLIVVLFSLGVWFIKHNIIEHSKGRDF